MNLLKPRSLRPGDTLGIFTPSSPGYALNSELFENGLRNLERMGFGIKLGTLTARRATQGYRSGSAQERAREFMELVEDPAVRGLLPTLGGMNSSSMIPYLDFGKIRESRKVICGFSDVTSLHLAILKYSRLRTFYGPSVMCWFGEWPDGVPETSEGFLEAVMRHRSGIRELAIPSRWSHHRRSWTNGDWKSLPREWRDQEGWRVLVPEDTRGPLVAFNLNTLVASAGTPEWPDLEGRILLLEEMDCPMSRFERSLRQLERMGVFAQINGLILGKPEAPDPQGAPFTRDDLLEEVLGGLFGRFPIVVDVDCGHTLPMLTVPQEILSRLSAEPGRVKLEFLEAGVE
jgi:muramoyltetrapeptide carboxypeptidase